MVPKLSLLQILAFSAATALAILVFVGDAHSEEALNFSTDQGRAYDYCIRYFPHLDENQIQDIARNSKDYNDFIHSAMQTCSKEEQALVDLEIARGFSPQDAKVRVDMVEAAAEKFVRVGVLFKWFSTNSKQ